VISYEKKKENCLETLGNRPLAFYQLPIYFPGKIEDTDTPLKIKKNIHNDGGVDGSDSFSLKKKWVMAVGCKPLIFQGVILSPFKSWLCFGYPSLGFRWCLPLLEMAGLKVFS